CLAQALGAAQTQVGAGSGLAFVERLSRDRFRERRQGAPMVDRGLGALGLDLVEDLRELGHLPVVEVQAIREEPERTPYAEVPSGEADVTGIVFAGHRVGEPLVPTAGGVCAET